MFPRRMLLNPYPRSYRTNEVSLGDTLARYCVSSVNRGRGADNHQEQGGISEESDQSGPAMTESLTNCEQKVCDAAP